MFFNHRMFQILPEATYDGMMLGRELTSSSEVFDDSYWVFEANLMEF
jgi:hypothetical protein